MLNYPAMQKRKRAIGLIDETCCPKNQRNIKEYALKIIEYILL